MKKYLMTGLVILMPVVLTVMIIAFLFNFFTSPFVNLMEEFFHLMEKNFSFAISKGAALFISRILVILFLLSFILILGVVARWFLFKNILVLTNRIISRIPIVKSVYKVIREIILALLSLDGKKAFDYPVLIPFPDTPIFCVGFSAGQVPKECQDKVSTPLASVFAPTAPHPISGFLFLAPQKEVHRLEMSNEEAFKFLVSCGLICPTTAKKVDDHEIF